VASRRFRAYWRWKSRGRPGRPRVSRELRELIQRMSKENLLWGAPRIHGELLKLRRILFASRIAAQFWRSGTGRSILGQSFDMRRVEPACKVSQLLVGPSRSE